MDTNRTCSRDAAPAGPPVSPATPEPGAAPPEQRRSDGDTGEPACQARARLGGPLRAAGGEVRGRAEDRELRELHAAAAGAALLGGDRPLVRAGRNGWRTGAPGGFGREAQGGCQA